MSSRSSRQTSVEGFLELLLGEALGYIRNRWMALNRFLEDGRPLIHNNAEVTNYVSLSRGAKAGCSQELSRALAERRRCMLWYQSSRLVSIDLFLYFRDIPSSRRHVAQRRIDELTPRMWAKALEKHSAA